MNDSINLINYLNIIILVLLFIDKLQYIHINEN